MFKSYSTEKGKNLATKEDIDQITRIVEDVKNEISLSKDLKLSFKNEERLAVLNYYDKCILAVINIRPTLLNWFTYNDGDLFQEVISNINEAFYQYQLADAKLEFYLKDQLVVSKTEKLFIDISLYKTDLLTELFGLNVERVQILQKPIDDLSKTKEFQEAMRKLQKNLKLQFDKIRELRIQINSIREDLAKLIQTPPEEI